MFVLSQDRLNMDLDRDCLELMLNLLESDVSYQQALDVCGLSSAQLEKNKQKVRELCAEIQSQGHAMHLNLDNITVSNFWFPYSQNVLRYFNRMICFVVSSRG